MFPSTGNTSPVREHIENDPSVIYVLDSELRFQYCNQAWDRFALENGGRGLERESQLGRPVMSVIPAPLRRYFHDAYGKVLTSGRPWDHCYECSSPTVHRRFRMVVYPYPESMGVIVVNSLLVEQPHDAAMEDRENHSAYVDRQNLITMCCECRRTCRANQPDTWDWVPGYLKKTPALITHGLCGMCADLLYRESTS